MELKNLLSEAEKYKEEIVADRRALHQNPEVGLSLSKTTAYIKKRLAEMDIRCFDLAGGVVALIGGEMEREKDGDKTNEKCVLLRADADALPVREKTDLPFASQNGCMHACGHDMHTAMLLGAARILKKRENELELCGTVKLVFQPDEEGFHGAKAMIAHGVLENPVPVSALALHVHSGTPTGLVLCGKDTFMAGCTVFRITVRGVGCHGAMPETGVDPIYVLTQIYAALSELTARELPPKTPCSLTVGKFCGGDAPNVIPESACLEGTLRLFDESLCEKVTNRMKELSENIARAYRAQGLFEILSSAPPLYNDPATLAEAKKCAAALFGEKSVIDVPEGGMGSEDFASYTRKLPCAYLLLGAGAPNEDERYGKPMHNESVVFNEKILPRGAALYAAFAASVLKSGTKNEP